MKIIALILITLALSGCASLNPPEDYVPLFDWPNEHIPLFDYQGE